MHREAPEKEQTAKELAKGCEAPGWKEQGRNCAENSFAKVDRDVGMGNDHCRRCRHGLVRNCRSHCCCSLASFYIPTYLERCFIKGFRFLERMYPPMQTKQEVRWMTGDPLQEF